MDCLGPSWRPSWGHLRQSWGILGQSWGHLGDLLGGLGTILRPHGLSWAVGGPERNKRQNLSKTYGNRRFLASSGFPGGPLGGLLGLPGGLLGVSWAVLGLSSVVLRARRSVLGPLGPFSHSLGVLWGRPGTLRSVLEPPSGRFQERPGGPGRPKFVRGGGGAPSGVPGPIKIYE